jgi:hypothetical protein
MVICPQDSSIMYVGAGDGTFATMKIPTLSILKYHKFNIRVILRRIKLEGGITSIVPKNKTVLLAGTTLSNMYEINLATDVASLLSSSHYSACTDIAFPAYAIAYRDLFKKHICTIRYIIGQRHSHLECKGCLAASKDFRAKHRVQVLDVQERWLFPCHR